MRYPFRVLYSCLRSRSFANKEDPVTQMKTNIDTFHQCMELSGDEVLFIAETFFISLSSADLESYIQLPMPFHHFSEMRGQLTPPFSPNHRTPIVLRHAAKF